MARRRPPEAPPEPVELWIPDYLRCGPCVEVWTPEKPPVGAAEWPYYSIKCWSRFRSAQSAWYKTHGLDQGDARDLRVPWTLRTGQSDWSYRAWAERGLLADLLARRGLPADWFPTPAPKMLMDLPLYGDPSPAVAALLRGE